MVNTAEVLKVEEVHRGWRLCVAGGEDHGLRRLMHKSVMHWRWTERSQHCKVQREEGPEAAKSP